MPSKSEEKLIIPLRPDYDMAEVEFVKYSRKETIDGVEEYEEEYVPPSFWWCIAVLPY